MSTYENLDNMEPQVGIFIKSEEIEVENGDADILETTDSESCNEDREDSVYNHIRNSLKEKKEEEAENNTSLDAEKQKKSKSIFHIVVLTKSAMKECVVVPSNWLIRGYCLLPPSQFGFNIERFSKNRIQPGEGWEMNQVKSVGKFESFAAAEMYLPYVEDQLHDISDKSLPRKTKSPLKKPRNMNCSSNTLALTANNKPSTNRSSLSNRHITQDRMKSISDVLLTKQKRNFLGVFSKTKTSYEEDNSSLIQSSLSSRPTTQDQINSMSDVHPSKKKKSLINASSNNEKTASSVKKKNSTVKSSLSNHPSTKDGANFISHERSLEQKRGYLSDSSDSEEASNVYSRPSPSISPLKRHCTNVSEKNFMLNVHSPRGKRKSVNDCSVTEEATVSNIEDVIISSVSSLHNKMGQSNVISDVHSPKKKRRCTNDYLATKEMSSSSKQNRPSTFGSSFNRSCNVLSSNQPNPPYIHALTENTGSISLSDDDVSDDAYRPPQDLRSFSHALGSFSNSANPQVSLMETCSCHSCANSLELKKLMKKMSAQLKSVSLMVEQALTRSPALLDNANEILPRLPNSFPEPVPLQNLESLDTLEEYLNDEDHFLQAVSYFSTFGGKDQKQILHLILCALISNLLAIKLNWLGRGSSGKVAFCHYKRVHSLIYSAAKRNAKCDGLTMHTVQESCNAYLRNARDRCGGRSRRSHIHRK